MESVSEWDLNSVGWSRGARRPESLFLWAREERLFNEDPYCTSLPHRSAVRARHGPVRVCARLVLQGFDYGIAFQIGGEAADEAGVAIEGIGGQGVVIAHVVGRHQDVLSHDHGKVSKRNAAVLPIVAVMRGRAI